MRKHPFMLLLALAPLAGPAKADLAAGLLAHYSFNGHTNDISGNANHGTPVGGFGFAPDRFGNPSAAGEFNGLDSYVYVPNSASLSAPDSACTQAAWIYLYGPSLVGTGFGPITMKSATLENAFMYRMIASQVGFGSAFNNWLTHVSTPQPLDLDRWYHVATVFDGSTLRFFLDGVAVDTVAMALTIVQDARPLTIGADTPGVLEIFNGRIDELRIYDRALGNEEIADLYGGLVGVDSPGTDPQTTLGPGFPNPAAAGTRVSFSLASAGPLRLDVYDVGGRVVRTLLEGTVQAGRHTAIWDGLDTGGGRVPAGVYFVRLRSGTVDLSRRLIRVR